jgi:hypothetical protein
MPQTDTDGAFGFFWTMPTILIFLVGGFLQYIGLLSQTESNWFALLLFSHVLFRYAGWNQIGHEGLLGLFLLFIALSYFQRGGPISYTLTYFYYISCSIIAAVAGRVYASRIASLVSTESYFSIAKWFLLIELVVVSVQSLFTKQFISLSRAHIGDIDAVFGTFFLQSDAALAAVCELLTISTFTLYGRSKDRIIIALLSFAIIFLGNSNTAKFAILLILVLLLVYDLYMRLHIGRYVMNILITLGAVFVVSIMYSLLSGSLTDFVTQATNDYYRRESWVTATRFSPFGQIFAEGINFFGRGPLTYYNPITKEWLYNAGLSTLYSLYIDFGAVGLFIYYLYQCVLIARSTRNYLEFMIFACVLVLFSIFNFALTDITFVFSFNAVLYLNYLRGRSSSPRSLPTDSAPVNV